MQAARREEATSYLDRPEHELLLCCARTRVDGETAARVRSLLGGKLDWEYLFKLARRHSVLPLLFVQLNAVAPELVPPEQLARLRRQHRDNTARNLFLTGELCRVLRLFESEGVEAVPYKGPVLAARAYGDLSLRRFVDLDVMVRKRDVPRAVELLKSLGYEPHHTLTDAQQTLLLRTQHNLPLTRDGGRLLFELHWEVASESFASSLQAENLWARLETVSLNGMAVKSLSPEDLLLSLCVHGSKHLWERLAWVCDVAELLRTHADFDWPRILERARLTGSERMLLLGLHLAARLLDAPLPEAVSGAVAADGVVAALSAEVCARLFDGVEHVPAGIARSLLFNLRSRKDLRDKFRYFRFMVTPTDGDIRLFALPGSLAFVYYLVRPFRLIWKGNGEH